MITETRYTLEARLAADDALNGMLDRDPNVTTPPRPAILYSHMGTAPPPITCLTYRLTTLTPEKRFRPALPALSPYSSQDGTQPPAPDATSPITEMRFDFESWTLKGSGAVHDAIFERLLALLDNQAWLVLDKNAAPIGRVFKGACLTAQPNLYDDKLNARLGLYSFLLRVLRTPA